MISLELSNVPVSAAAVCTTFAVKADRGGGPSCGQPVTSMYWKPLYEKRGSQVSGSPSLSVVPARVNRSVWKPAWNPPLLLRLTRPPAVSFSPCAARIVVPAGPVTAYSTQPAITRGNLTTYTPGSGSVTSTAGNDSITSIGCWRWLTSTPRGPGATEAGAHLSSSNPPSSNPALSQPGRARRAS